LRRLGTDYIDLYQIHWPDVTTPIEDTMGTIAQLITQGKVRYAGVCNYDADQLQEAQKYIDLLSNQVPYSLVTRKIEKEVVPYCVNNNLSIIAYSPLERGLLTGKIKPGHQFVEGDHRPGLNSYKPENITRTNAFLEKIRPLANEKKVTLSQLVIRWTIEQPAVTTALVGARNAKQAIENAGALELKLSREEIDFITEQSNELNLVTTNDG
ncbi:MAG TPA: aldo/keto reductase, partial [Chitinophagaceae bacterium]